MAEKRVSVRLAAVGGRQVRAELEGIGESGSRGFGRLSQEMEAANKRLAGFSRAIATSAKLGAAALTAAVGTMVRSSLEVVDAQAKLAQSLGTTVESVQILSRAGDLAGVAFAGIEQATKDLTRRLSQAASGTGPVADALGRLNLTAGELIALPVDERVSRINDAIASFVPAAERAAVAGQLFGEEGSIAMSRIDTATLRQATADIRDFGVAVSEEDADQIERTNDAISRLGLVWRGLSNQLAVAAAPALEAVANTMAAATRAGGPLNTAIRLVFDNIGRLASCATAVAGFMAGRWVAGMAAAALSVRGLATALVVLRGALVRTGIGVLVAGAGELIYQFGRLVGSAGGFGNALSLLADVASEVWDRIKTGGRAVALALQSVWARIEAGWLSVMARIQKTWADLLHRLARGLDGLPGLDELTLRVSGAAVEAGSGYYELAAAVGEADKRADALAASAADAARAAIAPLVSIAALGQATADAGADGEVALAAASGAADSLATSVSKSADAAKAAKPDLAETAEAAKTGWQQAQDALADYTKRTMALGENLGGTLVDAFRSAEDAFAEFVRGGKVEFRSLVSSMLVDIARVAAQRFIFGPLSGALSAGIGRLGQSFAGLFGGASAGLTLPATALGGLYHQGGVAGGGTAPLRLAPAAAFAHAHRYHDGGVAGLRPDEVPAILQRGERVLSRRETAAYDRDRGAGGVNVTIVARDADSVRQSRTQIAADIARAVSLGRRGL